MKLEDKEKGQEKTGFDNGFDNVLTPQHRSHILARPERKVRFIMQDSGNESGIPEE
jgi:hypothetical protein